MILTDDIERLSLFQQRFDKKTQISDFIDCSVDTGTCITEHFSIFVERHIKYTKKIKLNARRHNVKFRSIQII